MLSVIDRDFQTLRNAKRSPEFRAMDPADQVLYEDDLFGLCSDIAIAKSQGATPVPIYMPPAVVYEMPPMAAVPIKPQARSKGPDRPLPRPAVPKPDFVVIQIEPDPVPEELLEIGRAHV